MSFQRDIDDDSQRIGGGSIPGVEDAPAYFLASPHPTSIPVLIAVPHAGRVYPPSLLERMRNPEFASLRLEDRYVDRLAKEIAEATGAALLVANAPRAMIDLNRAQDDVDWEMIARTSCDEEADIPRPGRRARSGLGLVPRRLPGLGEIWRRRLDQAELAARIAGIHEPYHRCLASELNTIRDHWGSALLVDLHSMPPLAVRAGQLSAEFVVGDRFGTACHGGLIGSAFSYFAEMRRRAAHNRPYAGGYVLDRHAAPGRGLHAFQLEIDRSSYLDSRLAEPGAGFAPMVDLLSGLVRNLAEEVAALGRGSAARWADAAE